MTCVLHNFGAVTRATVKVLRKGRTVAIGSVRPGRGGKLTIKPGRTLRRGTYRVTITLRDARGAKRNLSKTLKVR